MRIERLSGSLAAASAVYNLDRRRPLSADQERGLLLSALALADFTVAR